MWTCMWAHVTCFFGYPAMLAHTHKHTSTYTNTHTILIHTSTYLPCYTSYTQPWSAEAAVHNGPWALYELWVFISRGGCLHCTLVCVNNKEFRGATRGWGRHLKDGLRIFESMRIAMCAFGHVVIHSAKSATMCQALSRIYQWPIKALFPFTV